MSTQGNTPSVPYGVGPSDHGTHARPPPYTEATAADLGTDDGSPILSCDSRVTPRGQNTVDWTELEETVERVCPSSNPSDDADDTTATAQYSHRGSSSWQTLANDATDPSQPRVWSRTHQGVESATGEGRNGGVARGKHSRDRVPDDEPRRRSGTYNTNLSSEAAVGFSNDDESDEPDVASEVEASPANQGEVEDNEGAPRGTLSTAPTRSSHPHSEPRADESSDEEPHTRARRTLPPTDQAKASVIRRLIAEYNQAREERLRSLRGDPAVCGEATPSSYPAMRAPAAPREGMSMLNRGGALGEFSGVFSASTSGVQSPGFAASAARGYPANPLLATQPPSEIVPAEAAAQVIPLSGALVVATEDANEGDPSAVSGFPSMLTIAQEEQRFDSRRNNSVDFSAPSQGPSPAVVTVATGSVVPRAWPGEPQHSSGRGAVVAPRMVTKEPPPFSGRSGRSARSRAADASDDTKRIPQRQRETSVLIHATMEGDSPTMSRTTSPAAPVGMPPLAPESQTPTPLPDDPHPADTNDGIMDQSFNVSQRHSAQDVSSYRDSLNATGNSTLDADVLHLRRTDNSLPTESLKNPDGSASQRTPSSSAPTRVVIKEPKAIHAPPKYTANGSARYRRELSSAHAASSTRSNQSLATGDASTDYSHRGSPIPPPALRMQPIQNSPRLRPLAKERRPQVSLTDEKNPVPVVSPTTSTPAMEEGEPSVHVVKKACPYARSVSTSAISVGSATGSGRAPMKVGPRGHVDPSVGVSTTPEKKWAVPVVVKTAATARAKAPAAAPAQTASRAVTGSSLSPSTGALDDLMTTDQRAPQQRTSPAAKMATPTHAPIVVARTPSPAPKAAKAKALTPEPKPRPQAVVSPPVFPVAGKRPVVTTDKATTAKRAGAAPAVQEATNRRTSAPTKLLSKEKAETPVAAVAPTPTAKPAASSARTESPVVHAVVTPTVAKAAVTGVVVSQNNGDVAPHQKEAAPLPPPLSQADAPPPSREHPTVASPPARTATWSPPPLRSQSRPTDEPDLLVPAVKYSYDVKTGRWATSHFMVRVLHPNRGLSQGGMRVAFEVEELDETGFGSAMVAKMFRHNITDVVEDDYLNECEAQCMCEEFADSFNKVVVPGVQKANISFLQCSVVKIPKEDVPEPYKGARKGFFSYRTTDTRDILFNMEPRLTGNFTKYTSNFGDVYETNERYIPPAQDRLRRKVLEAVEAFSHFTLVESGGSMLVCDLQGVNDFLTDPQIHTEDGEGFGMGNMGQEGINEWVKTHKCKDLCKAMHLQPLTEGIKSLTDKKRGSYFRGLVQRLQSHDPVQPQELLPPPKPLEEMTDEEKFEYAVRLSQMMDT